MSGCPRYGCGTKTRIVAALRRAHRRNTDERATAIMQVLRAPGCARTVPSPARTAFLAMTCVTAELFIETDPARTCRKTSRRVTLGRC